MNEPKVDRTKKPEKENREFILKEIPDELWRKVEAKATHEKKTIRQIFIEALEASIW